MENKPSAEQESVIGRLAHQCYGSTFSATIMAIRLCIRSRDAKHELALAAALRERDEARKEAKDLAEEIRGDVSHNCHDATVRYQAAESALKAANEKIALYDRVVKNIRCNIVWDGKVYTTAQVGFANPVSAAKDLSELHALAALAAVREAKGEK